MLHPLLISLETWKATSLLPEGLGISIHLFWNLKDNHHSFALSMDILACHQNSSPFTHSSPATHIQFHILPCTFVYNNLCLLLSEILISLDSYFCASYNLSSIINVSFMSENILRECSLTFFCFWNQLSPDNTSSLKLVYYFSPYGLWGDVTTL